MEKHVRLPGVYLLFFMAYTTLVPWWRDEGAFTLWILGLFVFIYLIIRAEGKEREREHQRDPNKIWWSVIPDRRDYDDD